MKFIPFSVLGLICLISVRSALAVDLVGYAFTGSIYTPTTQASNVTGGTITYGSGLTNQGISGANGSPAPSLYVFTNVINEEISAASNDYVTFTVTAAAGYELDLAALSFSYTVNSSTVTPTTETGTFAVRSNIDAYAANIASFDKAAVFGQNNGWVSTGSISLTGGAYQNLESITFRIFFGDNIDSNSFSMRIDNILLTGDIVSVIPEPSSFAGLAGAGILGFAVWRRRSLRG